MMIDEGARVREAPSEGEGPKKADHYDGRAETYSRDNESSLINAHCERPAG